MTRRLRAGALSLTFVFASSSAASEARAQNTLVGHWEGAITQPAGELKIVVDFKAASDTFTGMTKDGRLSEFGKLSPILRRQKRDFAKAT